jgi:hypothetical protein
MRKMTPSHSASPPETVEDCRVAGETLGREMRGRPRVKFETVLMQRLDGIVEQIAASTLDAEEAIAAFDVAAWDTWEAVLTGTTVPEPKSEAGRSPGRNKSAT